jgi:hypothetical protein
MPKQCPTDAGRAGLRRGPAWSPTTLTPWGAPLGVTQSEGDVRGALARVGRNLVYGLVAPLLLFSLSVAVQRAFFSQAPDESDLRQATSAAGSERTSEDAGSFPRWRGGLYEVVTPDSGQPMESSPPARPTLGAAPGENAPPSPGAVAGFLPAFDPRGWIRSVLPVTPASQYAAGGGAGVPGGPAAQNAAPSAASLPPTGAVLFGDNAATVCQAGAQDFVLDNLRDLYVCRVFAGLAGTYTAQLTFVSPDGNVYQSLMVAFATTAAVTPGATIEVNGRELAIQPAGQGPGGQTQVVAMLPVAGTYISQYHLVGSWTVNVSLNGRPVDQGYFALQLPA